VAYVGECNGDYVPFDFFPDTTKPETEPEVEAKPETDPDLEMFP
jgi:hypothetical protein